MSNIIWNRMKYLLSPQYDVYEEVSKVVRGRVADIGFGTGFGTHLFTAMATEVHGFEIDKDAINFAEKVFPIVKLSFHYGDINKGINTSKPFDYVIMIDVIEHLKYDKRVLENAKSLMANQGTLILSTPNRLSRYRTSANHVREYAPKELESLCRKVFVNVELKNHKLEPISTKYQNPIIAVCKNEL